jgi:L-lactate utilization protein LutB
MIEVGGSAGLEEQEGNTRLASAALDMYKALVNAEKMLAQFLCVVNTNAVQPHLGFGLKDSVTEVFTKDSLGIRAAIAKAEGTN